jgi:Trk-type K+ transport system membrane component
MKFTSAFHKTSICAAWAALAFIAFATLSPIQYRPTLAGPQLEHFAALAAMGCAFVLAYPGRTTIVIVIVVGSAFGLEALQLLTPDRHGRTIDALAKAAGGLGGIGIGHLALWALQKHGPRIQSLLFREQSAN